MSGPDPMTAVARRLADRFAVLPQVEAVAMGGSGAAGRADDASDVDLYVYAHGALSLDARAAILAGSPRAELGNCFFEPGDEWIDAETGVHLDAMYREPDWIEAELDRVLVRHEARVGYSTAFWYGLRTGVPLFDRTGWYTRLRERARAPYPEALVRAVVSKNLPLLRGNLSSYPAQLAKAAVRRDAVSANHRTAALLASAFDIVFAVNRLPHPGEKRLLAIAEATCPLLPPDFSRQVEALLSAAAVPLGPELARVAEALGTAMEELCRRAGVDVTPPRTSTA